MFVYPNINPVAFHLGPLKVHWYGLMYILGIGLAWLLALKRVANGRHASWTQDAVVDLVFYITLGLIVGGRVGYVLFYNIDKFLVDPIIMFKIWQGGMSFHGGLLGSIVALWLFSRRYDKPFFNVSDFTAPLVPLGLGAGRLGNFINGELWGRVTEVPWAVIYPHVDNMPRHPSQLYECLLEGVLLFIILWTYSSKPRPLGCVSGVFLVGYGFFRIIAECFRAPDNQIGFLAWSWLTMGQLLSLPMVLLGAVLLYYQYQKIR